METSEKLLTAEERLAMRAKAQSFISHRWTDENERALSQDMLRALDSDEARELEVARLRDAMSRAAQWLVPPQKV